MYLKKELYALIHSDESIFDFIQNGSLDGLWYWDLENPENEWMNARFWTVLGYHPDEMPHKSSAWQSIINQDDLKVANENFVKHCEDPNYPYDQLVRYTHKDGSTKWIRCRGLAIRDSAGKPIRMLGAHQDITELKRSEQELYKAKEKAEENEFKLKEAQQIAHVGNWELSLLTNKLVWSDEIYRIFDCEPQEFEATYEAFIGFIHPDDREKVNSAYLKSLDTKTEYQIEHRIITKNNQIKYVKEKCTTTFNEQGKPLSSFGIVIDITESKQAEEEVVKYNKMLGLVMNSIPQFIFWKDRSSVYLGCNENFAKVAGLKSPDEIIGKTDFDLAWKKEEALFFLECDERVMKSGLGEYHIIEPQQQADGKQAWLDTNKIPLFDEVGKVIGVLGTYEDITERKQAEKELNNTKQKAEESEANLRHLSENLKQERILLRTIIDSIPDAVYVKDLEARKVLANKADCQNCGFEKEKDLIGKTDLDLFPVELAEKQMNDDKKVILEGIPLVNREECIKNPNYGEKWLITSKLPLCDDTGKIFGLVGIGRDFTERKKAELALLAKVDELERFFKITIGRETTMVELKKEVNNLLNKLGQDNKYTIHE